MTALLESAAKHQRQNGQHNKDNKQDLGNGCGPGRNTPKAQNGGNDGNNEKHDGIVQHGLLLLPCWLLIIKQQARTAFTVEYSDL